MKAQMLKMSGMKDEESFYKKFPTEKSFMAKYGKQLKKATDGLEDIKNNLDKLTPYNPADFIARDENAPALMQNRGTTVPTVLRDNKLAPMSSQIIPGRNDSSDTGKALASIPIAGKLAEGISALVDEGKQRKSAEQSAAVSDLTLQASRTMPEKTQRKYVRPEDTVNTGEDFFPTYGVGTNALAKNGRKVKGNKTEIQNTYAPYTIYDDLEGLPKAAFGFSDFMGKGGGGTETATNVAGELFDNNAGTKIGAGVGKLAKMIPGIGPVVGAIAAPVLSAIGGTIDNLVGPAGKIKKANARTDANMGNMATASSVQGIQGQYGSNMEEGGNINPSSKFAMGGDLQVYRGEAEQISENPYLPNGGETVMFRGPSHEHGGMPISYGKSGVEVEGGEPAQVLEDGTGQDDALTVFGNLKIDNQFLPLLGDPDAKGKKFKSYIADLSKKEKKATNLLEKSTSKLNDLKLETPFDKLALNSFNANMKGSDMKLKEIAEKKINAAHLQNAINDTAEENGLVAEHLAKGKIVPDKTAEFGGKFSHAKDGVKRLKGETDADYKSRKQYLIDRTAAMSIDNTPMKQRLAPTPVDSPKLSNELMPMDNAQPKQTDNEFPWMQAINTAIPYFRGTNQEHLDPNQLMGEMNALSSNQLEPVKSQNYQPQLDTPYDISMQDILNENQADFRSAQRMMGYNPAAQANLNAQKYSANQKVLGEQFRMNQAEKDKVYSKNRDLLNDAQLKNLSINDQQYTRQAEALSNTKATTLAALNSISDKYAKNKLENKTLGIYENLYNYRFDNKGRAINENGLQEFNIPTVADPYGDITGAYYDNNNSVGTNEYQRSRATVQAYDKKENKNIRRIAKTITPQQRRNGAIVRALKNI